MRAAKFMIAALITEGVDAAMALQIGACLRLEKPLIIMSIKGAFVLAKLRRIADGPPGRPVPLLRRPLSELRRRHHVYTVELRELIEGCLDEAKAGLERTGQVKVRFRMREPGNHMVDAPMLDSMLEMMNNGDEKDLLFTPVRNIAHRHHCNGGLGD